MGCAGWTDAGDALILGDCPRDEEAEEEEQNEGPDPCFVHLWLTLVLLKEQSGSVAMWEKGHFYPSLGKQKKNYTNNNNSKDDYKVHKINFRYLSLPLIKTLPSPHIKKKLLSVQIVCLYPLFYF